MYIYISSFKHECEYVYVCVRVYVYVNIYVNISYVPPEIPWVFMKFHEFPEGTYFFLSGWGSGVPGSISAICSTAAATSWAPSQVTGRRSVSTHAGCTKPIVFLHRCNAFTCQGLKGYVFQCTEPWCNGWRKWQPFAYCRSRPIKSMVCFHMILLLSTIVPVLATTAKKQSPIVFLDIRIFLWQLKRTINGFSWLYRHTFMICSTNAISQESPRKFITRWPSSSQDCVTVTNSLSI